jgi:hypothetical protein
MTKTSGCIRASLMALFIILSPMCWAGGKKDRQTQNQQPQVERQQAVEPAALPPPLSNPYFTGEGGKDISLGIRVPESQGLGENQAYLPILAQGILVADISKYSAISVLDRVSLDKVINETLDSTFEDDMDIVRLGHVTQVGNWMTGDITKTSTGYSLKITVTDTTSNAKTTASYTGTCTVAQFDDHSAIHRASLDLLDQMGVQLTDTARDELEKASTPQNVNAQTALAQGIAAQQRGTVIEAMAYYYNAVSFDPQLPEGNERLSILTSNISSGNIGENVRNDIQRRNEWKKLIEEAETFFKTHLPYEIVYNPVLSQGKIDYQKETVDLSFTVQVKPTDKFKVVDTMLQGLTATNKRYDWGADIGDWPMTSRVFVDEYSPMYSYYSFFEGPGRSHSNKYGNYYNHTKSFIVGDSHGGGKKNTIITAELVNEQGKTLATTESKIQNKLGFVFLPEYNGSVKGFWDSSKILVFPSDMTSITFESVNANDITDNLTIRILSVNGVNATNNSDYIRISTGR